MLSLRLLILVLLMPALVPGSGLFLFIRDETLQLKSFCVVDLPRLGW